MAKQVKDISATQRGTNQDQPITWPVAGIINGGKNYSLGVDQLGAPALLEYSSVATMDLEKTLFVYPGGANSTDTRTDLNKYDMAHPYSTIKKAMEDAANSGDNIFIGGGAYTYTLTAAEDYSAKVVDWHFGAGTSFTLAGAFQLTHDGDIYGDCGAFTVGATSRYTNYKNGSGAKVKVESLVTNGAFDVSVGGLVELTGDLSGTGNINSPKLICNNITGTLGNGFEVSEVKCANITANINWLTNDSIIECRSITTAQDNANGLQLKITASGTVANISNLTAGSYIKAQSVGNLDATGNTGSLQVDSQTSIGTVAGADTTSLILKCGTTCGNVTFTTDDVCNLKLVGGDFGDVGSATYGALTTNYECESVGNVYSKQHYGRVEQAGNLRGSAANDNICNYINKFTSQYVGGLYCESVYATTINYITSISITDMHNPPHVIIECAKIETAVNVDFSNGNQSTALIDISAKYIASYTTTGADNVRAAHTVVLRGADIAAKPIFAPGCQLHLKNCNIYNNIAGSPAIGVDMSPADADYIVAITAAVRVATTDIVTLTLTNPGIVANDKISIAGFVESAGFNSPIGTDIEDGVFTVLTADATTITYEDTRGDLTATGTMGSVYRATENVTVRAYHGSTNKPLYSACVVGLIDSSNTIYDADMLAV